MAKEQNLSLSPTKISGLCGRLMCCLNYEQEHYVQTRRRMPKPGSTVTTPDGEGVVLENNAVTESVRVKLVLPDESVDIKTFRLDEIRFKGGSPAKGPKESEPEVDLDEEIKSLLED
jgi:cell fate regulator YaaT (PSP1 superfamily)